MLKINTKAASIAWALLVLILCGLPGQTIPHSRWIDLLSLDKLLHALMFGIQAGLLCRLFFYFNKKQAWVFGFAISTAFGGITELLQTYVFINRFGDPIDFVADAIGSFIFAISYPKLHKRLVKKSTRMDKQMTSG